MFHGTWGYFQVVPPHLLKGVCAEEVDLKAFQRSMSEARTKPVRIQLFLAGPKEMDHWKSVVTSQISEVLRSYLRYLPGGSEETVPPKLVTRPPPIDPISTTKPNIIFLRLMDAPDNAAEGVGQVLDQVLHQIDQNVEDFASHLLVAGGDVGTNRLLESLRQKRMPSLTAHGSLSHILSVSGPAHVMWNVAKSLLSHHYGDVSDTQSTGAWRSWEALGGNIEKPLVSHDFNLIMRSITQVHHATLVFIIL